MHKYLICILFGIILFIIWNRIDSFSVGAEYFALIEANKIIHDLGHVEAEDEADAMDEFKKLLGKELIKGQHIIKKLEVIDDGALEGGGFWRVSPAA